MMFRNWVLLALFFNLTVNLSSVYLVDVKTVKEKESVVLEKNKNNPTVALEKNKNNPINGNNLQEDVFSKVAGFIGQIVRQYVVKPLSAIMNLLKKFSQHIYDNLDQFLAKSSHIAFKILETKKNLMTKVPSKILYMLITLFPKLEDRLQQAQQRLEECPNKFSLDGIKQDMEEVKMCVKPSFNLTIHDQIVIADRSLQILKIVDQSLNELENSNQQNRQEKLANVWKEIMMKGLTNMSEIIAAALDIKNRLVEMLNCFICDEGIGLVDDLMAYDQNFMSCLVGAAGSLGKCQCAAK